MSRCLSSLMLMLSMLGSEGWNFLFVVSVCGVKLWCWWIVSIATCGSYLVETWCVLLLFFPNPIFQITNRTGLTNLSRERVQQHQQQHTECCSSWNCFTDMGELGMLNNVGIAFQTRLYFCYWIDFARNGDCIIHCSCSDTTYCLHL